MADLYSNNADGWVRSSNGDWATARDDTSGATTANDDQYIAYGFGILRGSKPISYDVIRSFLYFDPRLTTCFER